jgi:hypothetical protein
MYFSAATTSENDQGNLEDGADLLNHAVEGRRHPADHGMLDLPLHLRNDVPGIALEPLPIEGLCHQAKLDDKTCLPQGTS